MGAPSQSQSQGYNGASAASSAGSTTATIRELQQQLGQSREQVTQLQLTVDGLEKERDFYFGKLRDVELVIQGRMGESMRVVVYGRG